MANMSYCRWENTANDLRDCMNSLTDVYDINEWFAELSEYEQQGFRRVMSLVKDFHNEVLPDVEGVGIEF